MAAGAIRGSRIGAGPMGEAERGEAAPRKSVTYFCSRDHETVLQFSIEAEVPDSWDCPRCGMPASVDEDESSDGAEDRAVQDAPRVREGTPVGRRGGRDPHRGAGAAAQPPEVRRHHLLGRSVAERPSGRASRWRPASDAPRGPEAQGLELRLVLELLAAACPGARWFR